MDGSFSFMISGAEWVWVQETRMDSLGMPVAWLMAWVFVLVPFYFYQRKLLPVKAAPAHR